MLSALCHREIRGPWVLGKRSPSPNFLLGSAAGTSGRKGLQIRLSYQQRPPQSSAQTQSPNCGTAWSGWHRRSVKHWPISPQKGMGYLTLVLCLGSCGFSLSQAPPQWLHCHSTPRREAVGGTETRVLSSLEGRVLGQKASSPFHSLPSAWADPGHSPATGF